MSRVLIIEDESHDRELLKEVLSSTGHRVLFADTFKEALALQRSSPAALVIADASLRDGEGLDLLRTFRKTHPDLPLVAMAGATERTKLFQKALQAGAMVLLAKPLNRQEIRNIASRLLPE